MPSKKKLAKKAAKEAAKKAAKAPAPKPAAKPTLSEKLKGPAPKAAPAKKPVAKTAPKPEAAKPVTAGKAKATVRPVKAKATAAPAKKTMAQDLYDAYLAYTGVKATPTDIKKFEETGVPYVNGKYVADQPIVPIKGGKPVINEDTIGQIKNTKAKKGSYTDKQLAEAEFQRYKKEGKLDLDAFEYMGTLFKSADERDRWKYDKVKAGEIKVAAAERDRLAKAVTITGGVKETELKSGGKVIEAPTVSKEALPLIKEAIEDARARLKKGQTETDALQPIKDLMTAGPAKELSRPQLDKVLDSVTKDLKLSAPLKKLIDEGFKEEPTRPELQKVRGRATEAAPTPLAQFAAAGGPTQGGIESLVKKAQQTAENPLNIAGPLTHLAAQGPAPTVAGPLAQQYANQLGKVSKKGNVQLGYKAGERVAQREYERLTPQLGAQYLGQGTRFSSGFQAAQNEAKLGLEERLANLKTGLKTQERLGVRGALPGLIAAAEQEKAGELARAQAASGALATEAGENRALLATALQRAGITEQQQLQLQQALSQEGLAGQTLNLDQFKTLLGQLNIGEEHQLQLINAFNNLGINTAQLDVNKLNAFLGAQQTETQGQRQFAGEAAKLGLAQKQAGEQTLGQRIATGLTPPNQIGIQGPTPTTFQTFAPALTQGALMAGRLGVKALTGI